MSWCNTELMLFEEAGIEIVDGDRGANYPKQGDFSSEGFCLFLNTGNTPGEGFDFSNCQFISEQKDAQLRKGRLKKNDVVLTTRGTIGNVALYEHSVQFDYIRINSGMVLLRCNGERVLPPYLYIFLRSPNFKEQVEALRSGAAQPQLPIRDIKRILMHVPSLPVQLAISEVVTTYDDLIATNQRRIALLEDAARRLYREWFVQLRFPGHEAVPVVDGVPEGWQHKSLFDVANVGYGFAFKAEQFNTECIGMPAVRIRDISEISTSTWTTEEVDDSYIIERGDFLIGMDGIFHMNHWVGANAYLVQRVCRVRPKEEKHRAFLGIALRGPIKEFEKTIQGATVAHLGAKHLKQIEVLVPADDQEDLLEILNTMLWQQIQLREQNAKLAQARDLLLPKLMSGQLDVSAIALPSEVTV